VLKKWALPILILYVLALTAASLMIISDMPSLGFSFDDKIYHAIAYFLLTLLVFNYCNVKRFKSSLVISAIVTIVYGIIIEVLQYVITTYRTFDIYDAIANTLGAILAVIMLKYLLKTKVKMN
jgi:VanZ family protein